MAENRDIEILQAIKSGDNSTVLNHLYKTALPIITKFVTRNKGDKDEAKDIFQDAIVTFYSTVKLNKYDANKDVNGFLYFVARNLWINRIKKKNRNKSFEVEDTESFSTEETPVSYLVDEERRGAVESLMDKVGHPCKELFRYIMYEKLSMKEVAEKMGYSGETVAKATHYQCKKKLAAHIYGDKSLLSLLRE